MAKIDTSTILQALDVDDVSRFADINASAPDLAIALNQRFGCDIDVLSLDKRGKVTGGPDFDLKKYLATLTKAGVDKSAVTLVTDDDKMARYDVIATYDGFGSRHKIKSLRRVLRKHMHPQSRLVLDIQKGSGSYPFLKDYGSCNTLSEPTGDKPGRVVMSVEPQSGPAGDWSVIAHELAGDDGFFTDMGEHSFLYIKRGDTLVVTFDNLDIAMTKRDDRRPWGFSFIEAQGWSMLGVMANGWTWFRDDAVTEEFDRLRDSGFFTQFKRVVFYGASMGGYGAAAFSAAAPGATVFVISPQATLDKSIVPWEMRYKKAWDRDFSGPYGNAAEASKSAAEVHLMYDPYVAPDTGHAEMFTGKNVRHWRCPLLGHRLGSSLHQMGVLQDIATSAISGTLDGPELYARLRKRHQFPRFQRELANLAMDRGRPDLAARVCRYVLAERGDKFFRNLAKRIKSEGR